MTIATPRRVAIIGGNRIPFARSNTAYATASNQQMLTAALQACIATLARSFKTLFHPIRCWRSRVDTTNDAAGKSAAPLGVHERHGQFCIADSGHRLTRRRFQY